VAVLDVRQHHEFAEFIIDLDEPPLVDEATFVELKKLDLKPLYTDQYASENDLGGEDLTDLADAVVEAMDAGYRVHSWSGPDAEVLVVGYLAGSLEFVKTVLVD
jgi:hypothetical protein